MFSSHSQVGKTRVNKVKEGKKRPPKSRELHKKDGLVQYKPRSSVVVKTPEYKVIGQLKEKNVTDLQKLYELQDRLLQEGYTYSEYENYVQEKINADKYYYKNLSDEKIALLNKRYRRLTQKDTGKFNEREDDRNFKRRQRKLYRSKRKELVDESKRNLINSLFKALSDSKVSGVSKNHDLLSDDPEKWDQTKLCLFLGGRYIESGDRDWVNIYNTLSSPERMRVNV